MPTVVEADRGDVELGPGVPARLAAVLAEVAHIRGLVEVRRPAAQAVLRIRGVLQGGLRVPPVVEPEAQRAP